MHQYDTPIPHILVVEDEVGHAELIRRAFADDEGAYEVETAGSIAEAETKIEATRPDLVIADLMLPDGEGTKLIEEGAGREPFPVIVMTSHGDESVAVEAIKAGALDYVVKSDESFRSMPHVADRALREWGQRRELRETRDALRLMSQVFVNAADPIIITDPTAKIVDVNRAAREIYGWSEEELMGRSADMLVPSAGREEARRLYQRALEGEGVRNIETTHVTKTGEKVTVLLTLSRLTDEQGETVGVAAISKDITERKRLEREVRQAQKMEAIGTLTSGIAHDFNNLLMGINGCTDIALGRMEADHPARRYVEEIKDSITRGASLTSQLLAFTRKEGGETEVVRADGVVRDVEELLRPLLGSEIDFDVDLGAQAANIECDPGQLEQVILNLVVNARDAIESGGRISLTTRVVHADELGNLDVGEAVKGEYLEIEVVDSGVGMDEETLQHIFEPFYTTKPAGEGTGLGLSTVYGIVNQWGGAIEVESEPGEGTRFAIYVQLTHRSLAETSEHDRGVVEGEGESILVVEDEPQVRKAVESYLELGGYRTTLAESFDEAVETLRENSDFAMALIDFDLGAKTGGDLKEWIRTERLDIPLLFMSAFGAESLLSQGELQPGDEVLQKPFSRKRLLAEVTDLIEGFRSQSDEARRPRRESDKEALLLVEDNDIARMATKELLEEEGYRTFDADSARRAFEILEVEEASVHCVLMDLTLPDADGLELAEEIREREGPLSVIFLSGGAPDQPAVEAALEEPKTSFLQKPIDIDVLLDEIRKCAG